MNENLIKYFDDCIALDTKYLSILYESINLQSNLKKRIVKILPFDDINNFEEIQHFNNYQGYIIISLLDLLVIIKNLYQAKSDWEKVFFIKHGFLTIHETIIKLKPYNGSSYVHQTIDKKYPLLKDKFKDALDKIAEFKSKESYNKIMTTRNFIAGHIEKTKKYYDTAFKLDGEEAGMIINEFLKILDKLFQVMSEYSITSNKRLIELKEKVRDIIETENEN
jgi:hypothetical protein